MSSSSTSSAQNEVKDGAFGKRDDNFPLPGQSSVFMRVCVRVCARVCARVCVRIIHFNSGVLSTLKTAHYPL